MIPFGVNDVINLLFSNSKKITEYYQSVNLAYENWTNNKEVYKRYIPHVANLSIKEILYNKVQLKYLGKLANSMKYDQIKNNVDKYNLSDIDMYFIGDLMAARVLYNIYQKCKTINKYKTQGLTYNNSQYVILPSFLSDHYGFKPKYSGEKQKVDTQFLIDVSHKHNYDLFNTYFKFITNLNTEDATNTVCPNLIQFGTSFAYNMINSGAPTPSYDLSESSIIKNTLIINISIKYGSTDVKNNKHVLLFSNNLGDSNCNLSEINLYYLKDIINVNTDNNKHYYLIHDNNKLTIKLDTTNKSVQKALGIESPLNDFTSIQLGIMNLDHKSQIFHVYIDSNKECSINTSDTGDTINSLKFNSDFTYSFCDISSKVLGCYKDKQWYLCFDSKVYNSTSKNFNNDDPSLPALIPLSNWVLSGSSDCQCNCPKPDPDPNMITINYTLEPFEIKSVNIN